ETAMDMHGRQEGWPAGMNAMCLGFYEQNLNGHRVISHGGDTELFHSDLFLVLDAHVGLFVSYNSAGRPEHGDARGDLYIKVLADPQDNTIYVEAFKKENGQPRHFREIAPMLFNSVDGPERVAFVKDGSGHRTAYLDFPFIVLQEVGATLDKQAFDYVVIGLGIGVVVLTILCWPVSAILRKHYRQSLMLDPTARKWRHWAKIACIIDIFYLLGFV